MKNTPPGLIFLVCLAPFLPACASNSASSAVAGSRPKTADEMREAEERKPPFIGMTREQALARYGEPRTRAVTDQGEQWTYLLNYSEVVGKALIPFNFKVTPLRVGLLTFDPAGKLKAFRWDAETNG